MRLYCAPALRPRAANFSQRVVSLVCLHCGSPLKSSSTWICTSGWTPLFFQGGGKSKLLFQLKPWWPSVVQGFALGKVAFCSSGFASSMAAFCLLSVSQNCYFSSVNPLEKKWGFLRTFLPVSEVAFCSPGATSAKVAFCSPGLCLRQGGLL